MTAQQLKNSILQMAVQGKLVPQDPNDEPASVLLERIRAEKEEMIKEGKVKKEKNPSVIFRGADNLFYEKVGDQEPVCIADEVPFEIPESWEWVRMGDLFWHNTGKALNASDKSGQLLEYITTSNLYWDGFVLDNLRKMYFTDSEVEKCTATKGDLLVCEGGDFGRAAIWNFDYDICIQNHIHRLRAYSPLCTEFYYYIFYLYKCVGWIGGKGIGIQGLSAKALHALLFPLPPLREQERIVKKIQDIIPNVEDYENKEWLLSKLSDDFPDKLKKSILQRAVQGKLVPQDSNDEPASVLLEKIRAEKEQLIQAGKIKRDKHESVIYKRDGSYYEEVDGKERCINDEIPFDIPENWIWIKVKDQTVLCNGKAFKPSDWTNEGLPIVRIQNLNDYSAPFHYYSGDTESKFILHGDELLFAWSGTPGTSFGAHIWHGEDAVLNQHIFKLEFNEKLIYKPYYMYALNQRVNELVAAAHGSAGLQHVTKGVFENTFIPLPPYNEQQRIVKKIEDLTPLVDSL